MEASNKTLKEGRCALVIPLANEAATLPALFAGIVEILEVLPETHVITVVDRASKDTTQALCEAQAAEDSRFIALYSIESKSVVDAYLAGFKKALELGAECIIEMDGGLSHNPIQIPNFYLYWQLGYEAVFGSRFIRGAGFKEATFQRRFLSIWGTRLGNAFLGTRYRDMTSGFEAFDAKLLQRIVNYPLKSKAHFFQTELRYLCRNFRTVEIAIIHKSPAKSVPLKAIANAIWSLLYYTRLRLTKKPAAL